MGVNRAWRWLVVVALLVGIAGTGWFVLIQERDHPLGRRNYTRIRAGMTREDVAQILRGPPGAMGPGQLAHMQQHMLIEQEGPVGALGGLEGKPEIWYNDRGEILVTFDSWDAGARVVGKQLYVPVPRW